MYLVFTATYGENHLHDIKAISPVSRRNSLDVMKVVKINIPNCSKGVSV